MHWILVIMMSAYSNNGGTALDHIPFADEESCQLASKATMAAADRHVAVSAFCVSDATPSAINP